MKRIYYCEVCNAEFNNEEDCFQHEQSCSFNKEFVCDKCGKKEIITPDDEWGFAIEQSYHNINIGYAGYGSSLDGSYINFILCDECLSEFIKTFAFEGQEKILNSGCNRHMSTEDWIKEAKGEFTDEDYEAYNICSSRQMKAYEERYPICDKVEIYKYSSDNCRSHCFNHACGDEEGKPDNHNCGTKCYECKFFKERPAGKEIPINIVSQDLKENTIEKIKIILNKIKNKRKDD